MRKKRLTHITPLSGYLAGLRRNGYTLRELARIAGTSPSVIHGWANGGMPSENVENLKRLCNHFGATLAQALTGSGDSPNHSAAPAAKRQFLAIPSSTINTKEPSDEKL